MKTFSELKRELQVGKTLTMTFNRFSESSENIKSRLNIPRKILKTQTNGITLEIANTGKGSFLELPCASLTEYDGKTIKIYECGQRDLTEEEKNLLKNEPSNRKENEELVRIDALSDGSSTYYMDKAYYKENDAEWRWDWSKGLRWDINSGRDSGKMWDKKVKGELSLQYDIN